MASWSHSYGSAGTVADGSTLALAARSEAPGSGRTPVSAESGYDTLCCTESWSLPASASGSDGVCGCSSR